MYMHIYIYIYIYIYIHIYIYMAGLGLRLRLVYVRRRFCLYLSFHPSVRISEDSSFRRGVRAFFYAALARNLHAFTVLAPSSLRKDVIQKGQ